MVVLHPSRNASKNVGRNEECIENPTTTVEADKSKLIREAHGEMDMVTEGKPEEENGSDEGEEIAKERNNGMKSSTVREWREKEESKIVEKGGSNSRKSGKRFCGWERFKVGTG